MELIPDRLIAEVDSLLRTGDNRAALAVADELAASLPGEKRSWLCRAHVHFAEHDYVAAISDLSTAILIAPPDSNEPFLYFFRGKCLLREMRLEDALEDFTKGIAFCRLYSDDYYRETLHFFRAYTLFRLGRKSVAVRELENVDDAFTFWIDKLRTKEDLLRECDD